MSNIFPSQSSSLDEVRMEDNGLQSAPLFFPDSDDDNTSSSSDDNDDFLPIEHPSLVDHTTIANSVHKLVDSLLCRYSPLIASMEFFQHVPFTRLPSILKFPYLFKKSPVRSDNAIGMIDVEGSSPSFTIVGHLCDGGEQDGHQTGPYFDMTPQNGQLTTNMMRQAKLQSHLACLLSSDIIPSSAAEVNVIERARSNFDRLASFLRLSFDVYLQQVGERDRRLYPAGVENNGCVHQSSGSNVFRLVSTCLFSNIPRSICPSPRIPLSYELFIDLKLPDIRLGHFADPLGCYLQLASTHNVSKISIAIPDFYNAQGELVHPCEYDDIFKVDSIVAVDVQPMIWDSTFSNRHPETAIKNPTRTTALHLAKMHILPTTAHDLRLFIFRHVMRSFQKRGKHEEVTALANELHKLSTECPTSTIFPMFTSSSRLSSKHPFDEDDPHSTNNFDDFHLFENCTNISVNIIPPMVRPSPAQLSCLRRRLEVESNYVPSLAVDNFLWTFTGGKNHLVDPELHFEPDVFTIVIEVDRRYSNLLSDGGYCYPTTNTPSLQTSKLQLVGVAPKLEPFKSDFDTVLSFFDRLLDKQRKPFIGWKAKGFTFNNFGDFYQTQRRLVLNHHLFQPLSSSEAPPPKYFDRYNGTAYRLRLAINADYFTQSGLLQSHCVRPLPLLDVSISSPEEYESTLLGKLAIVKFEVVHSIDEHDRVDIFEATILSVEQVDFPTTADDLIRRYFHS
ncbi:hypothetical protein EV360DRAFT_70558 [Lentinula raphanica]|nr:hypothetical protein EV360DRAFT_70558 [Lentinula raphanica]